ncbi:MAG: hypothetical protein IPJ52_05890 [Rhodocyclaceae bacterium]|nr:hypothetical protein [Rhodocyclaceae bacterium]
MTNDYRLDKLAAGDPDALEWMSAAALRVLASGGKIGIEQAAGLASTPAGRRRALRDFQLAKAATLVGGTPLELHRAVEYFRRACWPTWRDWQLPPESATQAEIALHRAFRAGSVPRSPQGLGKILRAFGFPKPNGPR